MHRCIVVAMHLCIATTQRCSEAALHLCSFFTQRYAKHVPHLIEQSGGHGADIDEEFAVVQEVVPITTMGDVIELLKKKRQRDKTMVCLCACMWTLDVAVQCHKESCQLACAG